MATPALEELIGAVEARASGDLDRLAAAVREAADLTALGDELIGYFVQEARVAGSTWSQVGERLGVTKQAAHQRFVASGTPEEAPSWPPVRVGRRAVPLDDSLRRAMRFALQEARSLRHNYLGTEHLLLGLLDTGEGAGPTVLESLGVDADSVRRSVLRIIGRGTREPGLRSRMTPRAKRVLDLAARETRRMRGRCVQTEHLVLGILREGEGVAAQILSDAGVTEASARQALAALDR